MSVRVSPSEAPPAGTSAGDAPPPSSLRDRRQTARTSQFSRRAKDYVTLRDNTVVEVIYDPSRGKVGLRGSHPPLSWDRTSPPIAVVGDRHVFRVAVGAEEPLEIKVVRDDDEWAGGRNYTLHSGDHRRIEPYFDRHSPELREGLSIEVDGQTIRYDVLLPPSYTEQEHKRYSVLYVLDGQSLWSHSKDPFGVWGVEKVFSSMYDLGAIEEVIVVGVHSSDDRLNKLSPVPDPEHGGGGGPRFLAAIADRLRPHVDSTFRTRTGPDATAILGSSMGGLFAFFAGWTRPDVFGKAACLSSAFWWANRWAVRAVETSVGRGPKTIFYLDSGAAPTVLEPDANVRDGFHHTQSMFRALVRAGFALGTDVHRLVFPGQVHDAHAWSSRIGLPLQLLFPPEIQTASAAAVAHAAAPWTDARSRKGATG